MAPLRFRFIDMTRSLTIGGANNTLNGAIQRDFFIYAGTVTINNLAITNAMAMSRPRGG